MEGADDMLGLCELKGIGVTDMNSQQNLRYKPGYMFVQIYATGNVSSELEIIRKIVLIINSLI